MRICVPVPCFFKDDFCDALRTIGKLGFDAAETYNWKNLDLDKVRATCEETGVELLSRIIAVSRVNAEQAIWMPDSYEVQAGLVSAE